MAPILANMDIANRIVIPGYGTIGGGTSRATSRSRTSGPRIPNVGKINQIPLPTGLLRGSLIARKQAKPKLTFFKIGGKVGCRRCTFQAYFHKSIFENQIWEFRMNRALWPEKKKMQGGLTCSSAKSEILESSSRPLSQKAAMQIFAVQNSKPSENRSASQK